MFLYTNGGNVYYNKENISFEDWFMEAVGQNSGEAILQMDIEGYEYKVLYDIPHKIMNTSDSHS